MSLLLGLLSLFATTIGAISGIGGGVIIKPVMDAVSGLPVSEISFLSGCTVLSMTVVSLIRSMGDSSVKLEPQRGTLLAVGAAIGGVLGKRLFDTMLTALPGKSGVVGVVQNVIMVILTLGVLLYVLNRPKIHTLAVTNTWLCIAIGLGLGLVSSFLGIGGGPINLVVLYFFFSMDTKTAALNSIYIILLSQLTSLISTFAAGRVPAFNPATLAIMMASGILGGFLGRALNKKMSVKQVDRLFCWLVIAIIGISIYNIAVYM